MVPLQELSERSDRFWLFDNDIFSKYSYNYMFMFQKALY